MCNASSIFIMTWSTRHVGKTWVRGVHECDTMTWLIHMCDMTHSYLWHDMCNASSMFIIWSTHHVGKTWVRGFHMCDMVTWLIHMCHMTYIHDMEYASCMFIKWSTRRMGTTWVRGFQQICIWISICIWMRRVTNMNASHHIYEFATSHICRPSHCRHMYDRRCTFFHFLHDVQKVQRRWVATISRLLKMIGLFCKRAL